MRYGWNYSFNFARNLFITASMTLVFMGPLGCSRGPGPQRSAPDRILPRTGDEVGSDGGDGGVQGAFPSRYDALQDAGRALEAGKVAEAERRLRAAGGIQGESPPARLLRARLALLRGNAEEAIRLYHRMTDQVPAFERRRVEALAEALDQAGRPEDAASQIGVLLDSEKPLSDPERAAILKKRAAWLVAAGETGQGIQTYKDAVERAGSPKDRDVLRLELAKTLMLDKRSKQARPILEELALKGASGMIMTEARAALKEGGISPRWSVEERLERANRLIGFRAFDEALDTLEPLQSGNGKSEGDWLRATILYKRRGHYKEALAAFQPIAAGSGPHADEARFLGARALSRLDRDQEAILAYRRYAKQTRNASRATEARFLAARLEFYLGRHQQTLIALEQLVGTGRGDQNTRIKGPGRKRDAHFLAGLSAILVDKPQVAEPHMVAASKGSDNAEVLARNAYWLAVARIMAKKKGAPDDLRAICEEDVTGWYARFAARRLSAQNLELGPCALPSLSTGSDSFRAANIASRTLTDEELDTLEKLSSLAALYARAGFYRDAANALSEVEKSGEVALPDAEWIAHYNRLDAPHFAIRRAAVALTWPPGPDERWLAAASYPTPLADLVRDMEKQHGLPSLLLYAIARKESLFDPKVVSRVGAMGLMQMMPKTYEANRKRVGLPKLKEGELPGPEDSIMVASEELADLFNQFGGSLPLAIMAYNAGPQAVNRWLARSGGLPLDVFVEKVGFVETRNYVRRVMKNLVRYRQLYGEPMPGLPMRAGKVVPKKNGDAGAGKKK